MQRAEWLKRMHSITEEMYDQFAPQYWVTFGLSEDDTHQGFLKKFLERVKPGVILSAGCGAGRYDGILLEAGHSVVGIDQSAGMLRRAREHFPEEDFPQLRYEKMGLQEVDFHEEFEGAICMDALAEFIAAVKADKVAPGLEEEFFRREGGLRNPVD